MGGNQLAICNGGRGFELGTSENKSRKSPARAGLEPGTAGLWFDTLTTPASYNRLLSNTQQLNDTNVTLHCLRKH